VYENVQALDTRAIREIVAAILTGDDSDVRAPYVQRCLVSWDARAREFYSYGRHFPLARYIPRAGRTRPLWIVNGDAWRGGGGGGWHSSRTPDHQRVTRAEIAASGIPTVVLPFSAIGGAGIELESIRPLHIREDAEWTEWDELPDAVDLDSIETASERVPFDHGDHSSAGVTYLWRGREKREYKRTLYRRAYSYAAAGGGEWREIDAATFSADPAGTAVSDHASLGGWRSLERTADGWKIRRDVHRLGDALFSAERVDPSGARIRRAVYLSSFDTNEPAPLYFLAEIPRDAGAATVETALDALAPRAVHAALARGLDVRRQGDVFFIPTRQTRDTLAADGATFARLTQWTRDAAPRAGEVNATAPVPIAERRRRAELERRARVRIFRDLFRGVSVRATAGYAGRGESDAEHATRRAETGARFADLFARHARDLAAVDAAGVDRTAPESVTCGTCGAGIGAACRPVGADLIGSESLAERLELERTETERDTGRSGTHVARRAYDVRDGIAGIQARELEELRRETRATRARSARPETPANARRKYADGRASASARVDAARESLRRSVFADASTLPRYRFAGPGYGQTAPEHKRSVRVRNIAECRANLARALADVDAARHARGVARDSYRALYDRNATACMVQARATAREKYRPETVAFAGEWSRRRERVRAAVAIFGTAHAATDTARTRDGRTYARGTVRHVPELEEGRRGAPDHRPLTLAPDVWYLAVRNTVPRQRRRRARGAAENGR
jgi:hypothetical protein